MLAPARNWVACYPIRVAALAIALYFLAGCSNLRGHSGPAPYADYVGRKAQEDRMRADAEDASAKVRRLEGELRQAKLERDDARLAGARRLLNWCTGILALCTVGGIVAAIFMRSKLLAYAALACAGGAASAQVFQRALDHIELISWLTLAAVVAVGGWMVWRYHRD